MHDGGLGLSCPVKLIRFQINLLINITYLYALPLASILLLLLLVLLLLLLLLLLRLLPPPSPPPSPPPPPPPALIFNP